MIVFSSGSSTWLREICDFWHHWACKFYNYVVLGNLQLCSNNFGICIEFGREWARMWALINSLMRPWWWSWLSKQPIFISKCCDKDCDIDFRCLCDHIQKCGSIKFIRSKLKKWFLSLFWHWSAARAGGLRPPALCNIDDRVVSWASPFPLSQKRK